MKFWMIEPVPGGPQVTVEANTQPEALDWFAQCFLDRETYRAAEESGMIPPTLTCTQVNNGPATDPVSFLSAFHQGVSEAMESARALAAQMNATPIIDGTPEARMMPAREDSAYQRLLQNPAVAGAVAELAEHYKRFGMGPDGYPNPDPATTTTTQGTSTTQATQDVGTVDTASLEAPSSDGAKSGSTVDGRGTSDAGNADTGEAGGAAAAQRLTDALDALDKLDERHAQERAAEGLNDPTPDPYTGKPIMGIVEPSGEFIPNKAFPDPTKDSGS